MRKPVELDPVYLLITIILIYVDISGGFKGGQGGHGHRPRTFGNPEGAPHLRKIEKKS